MKAAILSLLFERYPLEEMFRCVSALGYDGLDLYGARPIAYTYDMDAERINEVLRLAKKYRLEIPMYTPELLAYPYNVSTNDRDERRATTEYLIHSVNTASRLNIPRMLVGCGHAGYGTDRKTNFENIYATLEPVVAEAEKLGVTLILEALTVMESNTVVFADDVKEVLTHFNSPRLRTMLDTVTPPANRESFSHFFHLLKDDIDYIHFVDGNGVDESHMLLGTGMIDLRALAHQLRDTGYDGWLCVEIMGRYIMDPATYAERELRKLKEIFAPWEEKR